MLQRVRVRMEHFYAICEHAQLLPDGQLQIRWRWEPMPWATGLSRWLLLNTPARITPIEVANATDDALVKFLGILGQAESPIPRA